MESIPLFGVEDVQPEFVGIDIWINSQPLTLKELERKVVLVNFWRYSCASCIELLPNLRSWHNEYTSQGLAIVGVHDPKTTFQKDESRVNKAVEKHRLSYPIALDNDHKTSKAFGSRTHPDTFLFDKKGVLRHRHIGRGGYEEIEENIRRLLEE